MSTYSIKKNVMIREEKAAVALIEALEKAVSLSAVKSSKGYQVKELTDKDKIKAFLGEQL